MPDTMNVRRAAELAKIAITPEEERRLSCEMAEILALARQLQQVDMTDVPQTQHILPQVNVFRPDEVKEGLPQEAVLSAAPAKADEYIAVPRAVE